MLYPAELRVRLARPFRRLAAPRQGLGASSAWRCGPEQTQNRFDAAGTLLNVSTKELENGTGERRRIHDWAHRE
jgi:hypothetical protein